MLQRRVEFEQAAWKDRWIEVGEYTYGRPIVLRWDNQTRLKIGKFCSIAANVQIYLGGEHHTEWVTTYPFDVLFGEAQTPSKGDVRIGNDVWIGNNVQILSGVTIGDGAVIGAGAVVAKDVEPYQCVGGVPAKFIKWRFGSLGRARLAEMKWWDWPVDMIVDAIPILLTKDAEKLYTYWREVVVHE